jgi:hypothetical protein
MSDNNESQGTKANSNGKRLEEMVDRMLRVEGYRFNPMRTMEGFKSARVHLFAEQDAGQFAKQCAVPLLALCHAGRRQGGHGLAVAWRGSWPHPGRRTGPRNKKPPACR